MIVDKKNKLVKEKESLNLLSQELDFSFIKKVTSLPPQNLAIIDDVKEDYQSFINGVTLSFENNMDITVQQSGKPVKSYTCASFGCRDHNTKEWKTLIAIL